MATHCTHAYLPKPPEVGGDMPSFGGPSSPCCRKLRGWGHAGTPGVLRRFVAKNSLFRLTGALGTWNTTRSM